MLYYLTKGENEMKNILKLLIYKEKLLNSIKHEQERIIDELMCKIKQLE